MTIHPIHRVHMMDAKTQTLGERAEQVQKRGERFAEFLTGGIVIGAIVAIVGMFL